MSTRPHGDCTTDTITLSVSLSEAWKLHFDDKITVGHEQKPSLGSMHADKVLYNGNVLVRGDLSDDIAEEGVLSQSSGQTFEAVW